MVNKRLRNLKEKNLLAFGFWLFLFRIKSPNLMEQSLMLLHAQGDILFAKALANFF